MKYFSAALAVIVSFNAFPQTPEGVVDQKIHRIVMQFSVGDSLEQVSVIGQVGNIRAAWPKAQIEVVCHSSGLDLLTANKSKVAKGVADLSSKGVVFAACSNTMRRRNLKKEDLLPVSVIVPSAMLELVMKQEKGWAYLKAAH
jgi:intracellular sulfur oxidation DsrE/DsrF family protein